MNRQTTRLPTVLKLRTIVGLVVVALVAGHVYYWYWPRVRPATPDISALSSQLVLADSDLPYAVWVPNPHQNLGVLERRLGDVERLRGAVEEILGLASLEIPAFGPFRIPPAHEMALATDQQGGELVVALRMYPMIRWVLRAAGLVASNPWLSGGEMQLGGRTIRIQWQHGTWLASTGDLNLESVDRAAAMEPALALLRLRQSTGPIPAGLFRLSVSQAGLRMTSLSPAEAAELQGCHGLDSLGTALLWTRFEFVGRTAETHVMAVLSPSSGDPSGVPAVVVAHRGEGTRWRLPGEGLIEVVGGGVQEGEADGWSLAAYDRESLTAVEMLLPGFEELSLQSPAVVRNAGEVDLRQARRQLEGVARMLEQIPVVGTWEAGRWLATVNLLGALEGFDRLSIRVFEPGDILVEIWRQESIDTRP